MKIAYLILAHNTPKHLRALIRSLRAEGCHFFVHVDSKADIEPFLPVAASDVSFTKNRNAVYWGDFSQVRAIIELLRHGLHGTERFDYFVLLSGSDYPLYAAEEIQAFFERRRGAEFMNIVSMPSAAAGKPLSRLTQYKHAPNTHIVVRAAHKLLGKFRLLPQSRNYRRYFGDMQPYGGSTWWAITREAADYVLQFVAEHQEFIDFCGHCHAPDEFFFQTVLGNSPFRDRIARNLVYTDWRAGGANPAQIGESHIALFAAGVSAGEDDVYGPGELLFARKFPNDSEFLVAKLDAICNERRRVASTR